MHMQSNSGKMPDVTVSYPLGEDWPIWRVFHIAGSVHCRKRFPKGDAGALAHWRDVAKVYRALGCLPQAYYDFEADVRREAEDSVCQNSDNPRPLEPETEDAILISLSMNEKFRDAVRLILLEDVA